jgi:hypothetical protein
VDEAPYCARVSPKIFLASDQGMPEMFSEGQRGPSHPRAYAYLSQSAVDDEIERSPGGRPHSILIPTLNVLPLTVRSCNVAALLRREMFVPLGLGNVIVAIAPICACSPNGLGTNRL